MSKHEILCPCKSKQTYQSCCQPLHTNKIIASRAEQLMRSRYSAFVVNDIDYLIATSHPRKREDDDELILKKTIAETQWLGLKVIKHFQNNNSATVEFSAFYQGDSTIEQLHEKSRFLYENKHWFYLDGEVLPAIKLSRNDLCFCGSGKKVKKCPHS